MRVPIVAEAPIERGADRLAPPTSARATVST